MKIKTNIRSLPVNKLSNSATLYLYLEIFLNQFYDKILSSISVIERLHLWNLLGWRLEGRWRSLIMVGFVPLKRLTNLSRFTVTKIYAAVSVLCLMRKFCQIFFKISSNQVFKKVKPFTEIVQSKFSLD